MFFTSSALLNEFENIFSDIFGSRHKIYREIIIHLLGGALTQEEVFIKSNRTKSGDFSQYLKDLELAGFIIRDFTWNLKNKNISKLSRYRLKDNYIRFYLKYILPNKPKIKKGLFKSSAMAGWENILGLQFENLVLNNEFKILSLLNLPTSDIVFMNPYFQRKRNSLRAAKLIF